MSLWAKKKKIDAEDPLSSFRNEFNIPPAPNSPNFSNSSISRKDSIYLCGNSLGLVPKRTISYVNEELSKWSERGVEGHFEGSRPWVSIDEKSCQLLVPIVGAADESEVCVMNSLSVNNNLLLLSFYQPTSVRRKILIEGQAFCSDHHTIRSQLRLHGLSDDPIDSNLLQLFPRDGETCLRTEDIINAIIENKDELCVVWLGGVQYYTGQMFDIAKISNICNKNGIYLGLDLAHAVGNVPLQLHAWGVDFACWCSYKYLNSGPGCIAGAFVHSKHNEIKSIKKLRNKRLEGWWGQDVKQRFLMKDEHVPLIGAKAWQMSNPAVLPVVCLEASLEVFHEAGMQNLRRKSVYLTAFLEACLNRFCEGKVTIVTPKDWRFRGCQMSLLFEKNVEMVCVSMCHVIIFLLVLERFCFSILFIYFLSCLYVRFIY